MALKKAIEKALADLDELGDKAVSVRILGLGKEEGEEPSGEYEMGEHDEGSAEHPIAETVEKAVAEKVGEPREEPEADEMVDPALLEKLRKLLAD